MKPAAADYQAQAVAALAAVAVHPAGAFLWFGRRVEDPAPAMWAQIGDAHGRDLLVERIRERLHADFYGSGEPSPRDRGPVMPADDGGEFVRALSQANSGRGSWQVGWRGTALGPDTIEVVRPDGLRLLAAAEDCSTTGAVSAGSPVDVRIAKELRGLSPGLYVALADTPAPAPAADRVRLCWNISAAGAVSFVARVTYTLNGASMPFALQLRDNPARYTRHPTAVLLCARTDFAAVIKLLRPLLRAFGPHLADGAPAFTKPLARGLALAEEPRNGQSFGEHRCGLLAEAIVSSSERGLRTIAQRLEVVREQFQAAGVSLAAPYLEPGSDDAYELS